MPSANKNSVEVGYRTNIKEHGTYLALNIGSSAKYFGQSRPIYYGVGIEYYTSHQLALDVKALFSLKHTNVCVAAKYGKVIPKWFVGMHYKYLPTKGSHIIAPEINYHINIIGLDVWRFVPSINYHFEIGGEEKQKWFYNFYPSAGVQYMF